MKSGVSVTMTLGAYSIYSLFKRRRMNVLSLILLINRNPLYAAAATDVATNPTPIADNNPPPF